MRVAQQGDALGLHGPHLRDSRAERLPRRRGQAGRELLEDVAPDEAGVDLVLSLRPGARPAREFPQLPFGSVVFPDVATSSGGG